MNMMFGLVDATTEVAKTVKTTAPKTAICGFFKKNTGTSTLGYSIIIMLALLCLSVVVTAPPSASDCTFDHIEATPGCEAIAAFAKCLASTKSDDPSLVRAEKALAEAQEKTTGCDITVAPSFHVVDREVRPHCLLHDR
jgi:hypothetical protein